MCLPCARGQYHFSFEKGTEAGPDLFPGPSWEQVPPDRWRPDEEGALEGSYSLHHCYDNLESGCDYLIYNHLRPGDPDSLICSFRLRHGYDPSASNNWQLVLLADFQKEKKEIVEGLVLGVNYRGSDDLIRIWQCTGGVLRELCVTPVNYQEDVGTGAAPLFRLVWYREGVLNLFFAKDPSVAEPARIGSCMLEQLPSGRQLILRYEYSSARDRSLWLDEVSLDGAFVRDSIAPRVSALEIRDEHSLWIRFTEAVGNTGEGTFLVGDSKAIVRWMGETEVVLEFPFSFPNRCPMELHLGNICDLDGNCLSDTVLTFMRNEALWGEVVFNEIMADPDPPVRLPDEEYIELYNRSEFPLRLEDWTLTINERSYLLNSSFLYVSSRDLPDTLNNTALDILPFDYLVLKGKSLPNDGAVVSLYNAQNKLIHAVSYRTPWDAPDWKKEGGWALESSDPEQVCQISRQWAFSEDPSGGSPGRKNSLEAPAADQQAPLLLYSGYGGKGELFLYYSEAIRLMGRNREDFLVRPGSVNPLEVYLSQPLSTCLELRFREDLQERTQFTLELPVLSDCQGNAARKEVIKLGSIRPPSNGGLCINEIMYHPREAYPEFVELHNPGQEYFDLQDYAIQVAETDQFVPLSSWSRIVLPGQYLVLTSCVAWLEEAYGLTPSGDWVEVGDLPSLKNAGGALYLTDRAGNTVDLAVFSDDMHMDLLEDTRGISLERISTDRSGSEPGNWHSAASMAGYSTPGKENSQALDLLPSGDQLRVEPEVFSPDNDGFQDVLNITVSTGAPDWVISLWICDLRGTPVRQLANNHLAAPRVCYYWDGEGENGSMQAMGFYLILARGYHPLSGEGWVRRKVVGLVYR